MHGKMRFVLPAPSFRDRKPSVMVSELLERLIKLILAIYRVSDRLPQDEPLARFTKESALRFAGDFVMAAYAQEEYNKMNIRTSQEVLCAYFILAREQGKRGIFSFNPENFLLLERECRALFAVIEERNAPHDHTNISRGKDEKFGLRKKNLIGEDEIETRKAHVRSPRSISASTLARRNQIEDYFRSVGDAEISFKEIVAAFPGVSSRTVRRDIDALEQRGIVKAKGNTKGTFYQFTQHDIQDGQN